MKRKNQRDSQMKEFRLLVEGALHFTCAGNRLTDYSMCSFILSWCLGRNFFLTLLQDNMNADFFAPNWFFSGFPEKQLIELVSQYVKKKHKNEAWFLFGGDTNETKTEWKRTKRQTNNVLTTDTKQRHAETGHPCIPQAQSQRWLKVSLFVSCFTVFMWLPVWSTVFCLTHSWRIRLLSISHICPAGKVSLRWTQDV